MAAGLYNLIILHFTDIIQTNSTTNVWCDGECQEFSLMPQMSFLLLILNTFEVLQLDLYCQTNLCFLAYIKRQYFPITIIIVKVVQNANAIPN